MSWESSSFTSIDFTETESIPRRAKGTSANNACAGSGPSGPPLQPSTPSRLVRGTSRAEAEGSATLERYTPLPTHLDETLERGTLCLGEREELRLS
jgi:hypothetical protein